MTLTETTNLGMLIALVLFAFANMGYVQSIQSRLMTLDAINAKLDLLLKQAGIEYAPLDNLPPGVREALQKDNAIEAIRLYREATGSSLVDAKAAIDRVRGQAS